jgi:hypothetical protein
MGFLPRLRCKPGELLDRVAQEIGLPLGLLDPGPMRAQGRQRVAPDRPGIRHLDGLRVEPLIGIEQGAVNRNIDQRPIVVLAVDLDERGPQGLEHLDTHRLIVDESAAAAVGDLDAAQQQRIFGGDIVARKHRAGRVVVAHVEHRRDLSLLGPVPHQGGIATGAQRQREGVKQD